MKNQILEKAVIVESREVKYYSNKLITKVLIIREEQPFNIEGYLTFLLTHSYYLI